MPFKGNNSILLDFDAVVDLKLSTIRWLATQFEIGDMLDFDKSKVCAPLSELKFRRINGTEDIFRYVMKDDSPYKDRYDDLLNAFLNSHEEEILNYAVTTSMVDLMSAYKKAGGGIVKTTVRCDVPVEAEYLNKLDCGAITKIDQRWNIDMGQYTRLIVGNALNALKFKINEPKSILVVDYRENFTSNDITLLNPELVINLGDINDIEVISAYRLNDSKKFEG